MAQGLQVAEMKVFLAVVSVGFMVNLELAAAFALPALIAVALENQKTDAFPVIGLQKQAVRHCP